MAPICIHMCHVNPAWRRASLPVGKSTCVLASCVPRIPPPPPTPPVLVEKATGGVRVNIDAHSAPPQPQSIWNHSSLWRTNNLEETLIITHPFTPQNLLEASLFSALFLLPHFSVSAPRKVFFFFLPSALLSFLVFMHFDLPFLYVFLVTRDELWINIGGAR